MSARAIAIHGYEMSGERRANLEIKSECPALENGKGISVPIPLKTFLKTYFYTPLSMMQYFKIYEVKNRVPLHPWK